MSESDYQRILGKIEQKKGNSTYREYERHIRQFREWVEEEGFASDIFNVRSIDIEDMIHDMLDEGYSASSIRIRKVALSQFYQEALRRQSRLDVSLNGNPVNGVNLSEIQQIKELEKSKRWDSEDDVPYLKPKDIDKLARNVPSPTTRNELMVRLAFQTGLRRKELVGIKWPEDLNRTTRKITVREENAKSGQKRVVAYQPSLDFLTDQWIENTRPSVAMAGQSDYLFPSNRNVHISGQQFNDIVKEAATNAGIQSVKMVNRSGEKRRTVTAHILRHSFAMEAIAQGWNIYVLKNALGHSSVDITEMYLHDDEKEVLENYRERSVSARKQI